MTAAALPKILLNMLASTRWLALSRYRAMGQTKCQSSRVFCAGKSGVFVGLVSGVSSRSNSSSMSCEREPQTIGDRGFQNPDDGHLDAGGPPGSDGDQRLRGADYEMRQVADEDGRDDRRHA